MAQTTVRLNAVKYAKTDRNSPTSVVDVSSISDLEVTRASNGTVYGYVYVGFESLQSSLSKKRLYQVIFKTCYRSGNKGDTWDYATGIHGNIPRTDFDPSTLTWSNMPTDVATYYFSKNVWSQSAMDASVYLFDSGGTAAQESAAAAAFLKSMAIRWWCNNTSSKGNFTHLHVFKSLNDSSTPYVDVIYDDTENVKSKITVQSGPTGGYADPRNDIAFSWAFLKDDVYSCMDENFTQASATLYWKESTDENYTEVAVSGSTQSVTIPANTFPTKKTIQWYMAGTDDVGTTSQTPVYSFSTSASLIVSTPVSPINTVEDGRSIITLTWTYASTDGRNPTRFFLYWREEGASTWQTLYDPGAGVIVTSYNVPEGTFPAGTIEWGVQALNIDGVGGAVGRATFISYAAPTVNNVSCNTRPFATVTWQASDQQAYQIKVDDTVYGPYFGTEKSFELPDYLEDGEHTIGVAVVGTYALWSEWGEITVTVQNVPGAEISLDAEAQIDVELMISSSEEMPTFLIYRDDVLIAKTSNRSFTDRLALGEHTYKVISKHSDGNYSISNEVRRFAFARHISIAPLAGGEWLEVKYSTRDQMDPDYQGEIMSTYNHISGSEYPSAVISPYRDLSVSFSALFLRSQCRERQELQEMFGKPVIIKFRDGTVFVGILDSWRKEPNRWHYMTYALTVKQIDFEDYIDDTE